MRLDLKDLDISNLKKYSILDFKEKEEYVCIDSTHVANKFKFKKKCDSLYVNSNKSWREVTGFYSYLSCSFIKIAQIDKVFNWSKITPFTKVYVRNNSSEEWRPAYYIDNKNSLFQVTFCDSFTYDNKPMNFTECKPFDEEFFCGNYIEELVFEREKEI